MKRPDLFKFSTKTSKFSPTKNRKEIDLRSEFDLLLGGSDEEIAHSFPIIIRNMRRDADGYATECVCFDKKQTHIPDYDCSYCLGEGYLWDEHWSTAYSMHLSSDGGAARKYLNPPPGLQRTDYEVFFIRYDEIIKYEDKIIKVKLDNEGNPVIPFIRQVIHKASLIDELRSDYGRLEYLAIYCQENDAIKSDNPV